MKGKRIPLSKFRRLVGDLLHFASGVPTVPAQRHMVLAHPIEVRAALSKRPTWTAIFIKAYAIVASEFPELRRAYVKWPYAHLVEYPRSVATVTCERVVDTERVVLMARVKYPEERTLQEITELLDQYATKPLDDIEEFRRALRLAVWPRPLRRLIWWLGLNLARPRSRILGTFTVSVYSALGAESLHPLAPATVLLNYGVFSPTGEVDVRMTYDHRVMDGATVARALARLEDVLRGAITDEIRAFPQKSSENVLAAA